MQIKKAKSRIFTLVAFLVGAFLMYFYMQSKVDAQKEQSALLITNAAKSIELSKDNFTSCLKSYDIVTVCVADMNKCDVQDMSFRLYLQEKQREEIDRELQESKKEFEAITQNK